VTRRLRYSERKRLAETGALGDLVHDRIPAEFAIALQNAIKRSEASVREDFESGLTHACVEYFGLDRGWQGFLIDRDAESVLDFLEILAQEGQRTRPTWGIAGNYPTPAMPGVEQRINDLLERFRVGYRMERGEMHKVGSPSLEAEVIGPALLAVQTGGWEEVERSFREALDHQRGGETDDALTAANAAVEAALKAVGLKGKTLKELAKAFRSSGRVPVYLARVPELLENLLDRLHAARSIEGDAHGKPPGADDVPQDLADLAIHWAGSFLVYLHESTRQAPA